MGQLAKCAKGSEAIKVAELQKMIKAEVEFAGLFEKSAIEAERVAKEILAVSNPKISPVVRAQKLAQLQSQYGASKINKIFDRLKFAQEPVFVTPEGIQIKVSGEKLSNLEFTKKQPPKPRPFHNKMRSKPKGPNFNVERAQKSKPLTKLSEKELNQLASYRPMGYGPFKKRLNLRYPHYLQPEVRISRSGKFKPSGWHHDPKGIIKNNGLFNGKRIEISKLTKGPKGTYKMDWSIGDSYIKQSTFFPKDWSRETVQRKIVEAFKYCKKNNIIPELQPKTGNYALEGFTREGIEVQLIINANGEIITAFPLIK